MRRSWTAGVCWMFAALLMPPLSMGGVGQAAGQGGTISVPADPGLSEENLWLLDGLLDWGTLLDGGGTGTFVTVEGKVYCLARDGVSYKRYRPGLRWTGDRYCWIGPDGREVLTFQPGFVTVEGEIYHIEEDGFSITRLAKGFSVVDGLVCYSRDGLRVEQFTPGFVTLEGGLYYVTQDGYSFACYPEGVYSFGSELYCVPADGAEFLTSGVWNGLEFGPDGRYTSGNARLDECVKQVLASCVQDSMTQEQKLYAAYCYIRDHGSYLARPHYARGSIDWVMEEGLFFLQNGRGNCYSFAGAFMYLARQLGYQAYPVSGGVGYANKDHAWVIIPWADGRTRLFDVELEYAYRYRYETRHNYNLFKMTTSSAPFIYTFPN